MLRSMYTAISGLKAHQVKMDVIGNNIANVNTVGFKKSQVSFQEVFSQTTSGASAPKGGKGGTNPQQIGLGVSVGSIRVNHEPGSAQRTDNPLDFYVGGDGYFTVSGDPSFNNKFYTRAGNFDLDANGNLVTSQGLKVLGYAVDEKGNVSDTLTEIKIDKSNSIGASTTKGIELKGNLDSRSEIKTKVSLDTKIFDSLGNPYIMNYEMEKTADNQWDIRVVSMKNNKGKEVLAQRVEGFSHLGIDPILVGNVTFDENGAVTNFTRTEFDNDQVEAANEAINETKLPENLNTVNDKFNNLLADAKEAADNISEGNKSVNDKVKDAKKASEAAKAAEEKASEISGKAIEEYNAAAKKLEDLEVKKPDDEDAISKQKEEMKKQKEIADVFNDIATKLNSISKAFNKPFPETIQEQGVSDGNILLDNNRSVPGTIINIDWNQKLNGSKDPENSSYFGDESLNNIKLNFSSLTQYGNDATAKAFEQGGSTSGSIQSFSVSKSGEIVAVYDNGEQKVLSQVALAKFANPGGLSKEGSNLFRDTRNSGEAQFGKAGGAGYGEMLGGAVEMSNVDLSNEFTEMITTQRGFQANSRVITTSDEILQELVNLKR